MEWVQMEDELELLMGVDSSNPGSYRRDEAKEDSKEAYTATSTHHSQVSYSYANNSNNNNSNRK